MHIKSNTDSRDRVQFVDVPEPSMEETLKILKVLQKKYGAHHNVKKPYYLSLNCQAKVIGDFPCIKLMICVLGFNFLLIDHFGLFQRWSYAR